MLGECVVRETAGRNRREFLFEVNTKHRIYQLRARTFADMQGWIRDLSFFTSLGLENEVFFLYIYVFSITCVSLFFKLI